MIYQFSYVRLINISYLFDCTMRVYQRRFTGFFRSISTSTHTKEFYEKESIARNYFYSLDLKGNVFLEQTLHRNYATAFHDKVFLNLLYRNMKINNTKTFTDRPFVSLCGSERNFLTMDDERAALCFTSTTPDQQLSRLFIGRSDISQEFDPKMLQFSRVSSRVYHRITCLPRLIGHLGLVHDSISASLALDIKGNDVMLQWNGELFSLQCLD